MTETPQHIFDLDGVKRALGQWVFGKTPDNWFEKLPNGQTLVEHIDEHPHLLRSAPPTEYIGVVNEYALTQGGIFILSAQKQNWIRHTEMWLSRYLPGVKINPIWVNTIEEKLRVMKYFPGARLVEDCPIFPESFYKDVILINHKYNEEIKVPIRITTPEQLRKELFTSSNI